MYMYMYLSTWKSLYRRSDIVSMTMDFTGYEPKVHVQHRVYYPPVVNDIVQLLMPDTCTLVYIA